MSKYDFIKDIPVKGLKFYNPEEYNEVGVYYTIYSRDMVDRVDKRILFRWEDPDTGSVEGSHMLERSFIEELNSKFYVLMNNPLEDFQPADTFSNLYESEDNLEWAQDAAENPNHLLGDVYKHIDEGDIIELSGSIRDDEGKVLTPLHNEKFEVKNNRNGKIVLTWDNPRNLRPSNWEASTDIKGDDGLSDELPLYLNDDTRSGYRDEILEIKFIQKANHPF